MLFLISSVKTVISPDKNKKVMIWTDFYNSSNFSSETPSSTDLYEVDQTVLTDKNFYDGKYMRVVGLSPFQLVMKVKEQ